MNINPITVKGKLAISSDPHFSHRRILIYCKRYQFLTNEEIEQVEEAGDDNPKQRQIKISNKSIDYHDDYLIESINKVCGKDDTYICLGDFAFCGIQKVRKILDRINCKNIHLSYLS